MRAVLLSLALALLAAPAAAAQVVPTAVPTITPTPSPEPEPEPAPPPPPPPLVEPPPPGTQTVARGFDNAHSFHSAEPAATPPLGVAWKADFEGVLASPLVADGRAFVSVTNASQSGADVVALDATSGRQLWRQPVEASSFAAYLAYGDGVLIANGGSGRLQAFDAATGAPKWTATYDSFNQSFPVVAGGLVYLQAPPGLIAFDLASGDRRYAIASPEGVYGGVPAISGDRLFAFDGCHVTAYDRRDGRAIWSQRPEGCAAAGYARPALWGRRLFGSGLVFDADTGALASSGQRVDVLAGGIGIAPQESGLAGVDLATGGQLWQFTPKEHLFGDRALAAAGDTVLWRVGERLMTLDRRTGAPGWAARLPGGDSSVQHGGVWQDFAIGDGVVLVPAHTRLWALSSRAKDLPAKLTARLSVRRPLTYGMRASIGGNVTSEGITLDHRVTLEQAQWPDRRYRRVRTREVRAGAAFEFSPRPQRNSVLRVGVAGGNAKRFGVIVLPRISTTRLDGPGSRVGRMRVNVRVPRGVRLAGRTVGMYVGRGRAKRFTRLGASRLAGGRGRYRGTFSFTPVDQLGGRDFIAICIRGIHRQGMGYGLRLDRACGASSVRF